VPARERGFEHAVQVDVASDRPDGPPGSPAWCVRRRAELTEAPRIAKRFDAQNDAVGFGVGQRELQHFAEIDSESHQ
jgi:hypothetical protein